MNSFSGYQFVEQLYEGRICKIFRAIKEETHQPVIIKSLKNESPPIESIARIRREYEITSQLNFPGAICVIGLEYIDNRLSIIQEDIGAKSIDCFFPFQPVDIKEFLSLATLITGHLENIHLQNIIHKDINPSNIIWIPEKEQIQIIDFGISVKLSRENQQTDIQNILEGTLEYMSPEQTGRMNRLIDKRTDLYSLGVTFYELLLNCRPFQSSDPMELIHHHIAKKPIPPHEIKPEIPHVVSKIIMKLLSKSADERYQSALNLQQDLQLCLDEWNQKGNIKRFKIDRQDISKTFQIPQKLYGRDSEIDILISAYERVSQGNKELILVSGPEGIGKTALINEINQSIIEKRGYFISGEFAPSDNKIPYAPVIKAFQSLISHLVSEDEASLSARKTKLSELLGINGKVITNVIPEIERILGPQPDIPELPPVESQNRFHVVFKNFVKAVAEKNHPVFIFLDRLLWADPASLNLIRAFIGDPEIQYIFFVGAYRDDEISEYHPMISVFDELAKTGVPVHRLILKPLSPSAIKELIVDTLRDDSEFSEQLATEIYIKTKGNPLALKEFIKSMNAKGLFRFNPRVNKWEWNLEEIKKAEFHENDVAQTIQKIQSLPEKTQNTLLMASCLGMHFSLGILSILSGKTPLETFNDLEQIIQESLILPCTQNFLMFHESSANHSWNSTANEGISEKERLSYKFLHERIREAALSMIPENQKKEIYLSVAQILAENGCESECDENVLEIVSQINSHTKKKLRLQDQSLLSRLNMIAGEKAKKSLAHVAALRFFKTSISFLAENSWEKHYQTTLGLYSEATESAFLCGSYEEMEKLATIFSDHAKNFLDLARIYEIRIKAFMARNQLLKCIETAREFFEKSGKGLPKKFSRAYILYELWKTKSALRNKTDENLLNLPKMKDPEALATLRIASSAASAYYLIGFNEEVLILLLRLVRMTLKYGFSEDSAQWIAYYGLTMTALGDTENGFRYGQLALKLANHFDAHQIKSCVIHSFGEFTYHWKKPLKNTLALFLEGFQAGIDSGDLEYASFNMALHSMHAFSSGCKLTEIASGVHRNSEMIRDFKQETVLHYNLLAEQAIYNLMTPAVNPLRFRGPAYDEDQMIDKHIASNDCIALFLFYSHKIELAFLFGELKEAEASVSKARKYLRYTPAMYVFSLFYFYRALILLAGMDAAAIDQKKMKKVNYCRRKLEKWATHAPSNHLHKLYLVDAETAKVLGKNETAMQYYKKAIESAHEYEYLQEEALINELAAGFYLSVDMKTVAKAYIEASIELYKNWGASAKVHQMETKYAGFIKKPPTKAHDTSSTNPPSSVKSVLKSTNTKNTTGNFLGDSTELIDFQSLIKATQAISGEIVLEKLLINLMKVLIENAGAQKGFLLLSDNDDQLFIEAAGSIDNDSYLALQSRPVFSSSDLSLTIVGHVVKTKESLVLDNAADETSFAEDPYIIASQPKSILCMPINHKGKLVGALYLENNLMAGAFTPERLRVLALLSTQAAISIENARLYADMEKNIHHRTKELNSALQDISHLNEVMRAVNSTLNLDSVLDAVMIALGGIFSFDQIGILAIDEITKDLIFYKPYGIISPDQIKRLQNIRIPLNHETSWMIKTIIQNKSRYVSPVTPDLIPYFDSHDKHIHDIVQSHAYLFLPLEVQKKVIGLIIFGNSKTPFTLTDEDIQTVQRYVTHIGTAINNARLADDLKAVNKNLKTEIAQRLSATEALRESEKKYRAILDNMEDIYAEVDLNGNFIFFNQSALSILGYSSDEFMGINYQKLVTPETADRLFNEFNRVFKSNERLLTEWNFITKKGDIVIIDAFVSLLTDTKGKPLGFRGLGRDVTAKKEMESALRQSEEKYREILSSMNDSYAEFDLAGNFIFFNRAAAESLDYTHDELMKKNFRDLLDEKTAGKVLEQFQEVLKTGEPKLIGWEAITKTGRRLYLESFTSLQKNTKDKPIGFRGVTRDVTLKRKAEIALKNAKEAAEKATKSKSEFLANMSHEIRTPMNAILGMTDLLSETTLAPDQNMFVQTISSSGELLLSIINDILDFSKIEAGQMAIEETSFDLRDLVETAGKILSVKAHEKQLELNCRVAMDVYPFRIGDPTRLRQIFINLLGNAIKFTNQGEVTLEVINSDEPEKLQFCVRDTGIGIPESKQEIIFKSFSQVDTSITRKYGGTGLGLAICKRLVELMGGRIWIESVKGLGTRFFFTLTLPQIETASISEKASPNELEGKKVLVVDDNDTNRLICKELLNAWGATVRESEGGGNALQLINEAHDMGDPFHLVLLDLRMPEMDGFKVAEKINTLQVGLIPRIVMLTSSDGLDEKLRARELDIASFIAKPFRRSELLDGILIALGKKEKSAENLISLQTIKKNVLRPLSILIAEDIEANRNLMKLYLRDLPITLDIAENGRIAVEKFLSGKYDIVLMDIEMPEMDGLSATKAIRKWEEETGREKTPLIALTAHAFQEHRDKCLEVGCTGFLTKPIKKQTLIEKLIEYSAAPTTSAGSETPKVLENKKSEPETIAQDGVVDEEFPAHKYIVTIDSEIKELIPDFMKQTREDLSVMETALENKETETLRRVGHSLKGSARMYEFIYLGELGMEIEEAAQKNDLAAITKKLEELKHYLSVIQIEYR